MAMSTEQLQTLYELSHAVTMTLERADALLVCIEAATTHPDLYPSLEILGSAIQGVSSVLKPILRNGEEIAALVATR